MSALEFEPSTAVPTATAPDALVFAFRARKLLTIDRDPRHSDVPTADAFEALRLTAGIVVQRRLFLGHLGTRQVYAVELADDEGEARVGGFDDPGVAFHGLRALFGRLPEAVFWLAARAIQIVEWDRDHQFCGRCATPTRSKDDDRSRICPQCDLSHYPRLAPAVIVLVHDDDRLLLARSPHFPPGMYSTLAGFVEPGERLEDTVSREIAEEVGVAVADVEYFGSQPWPFPHSLMIGFTARYAGGALSFGGDGDGEIEDAAWFSLDELPQIPPRISIARALIDGYRSSYGC